MKDSGSENTEGMNEFEVAIITFSILLTSISFLSICLYCWFPKLRRKKKKFGVTEHTQISTNDPTRMNGNGSVENGESGNPFSKFSTIFTASSAFSSPRRPFQAQSSVESQYTYQDKPPMTLKTETVQPPIRTHSAGSTSSQKGQLTRKPSGLLKLIGNEIFQDETKPPDGEYLGKLEFAVSYDFQVMTLTVRVIKAVELPAMDLNGTSDPFVKCCLLPDRKRKLETNIRRKTCNPTWGETFLFEGLPYDKVQQRVLYLQVMDHDRFSRNDPIGEVYLPLHTMDLTDDNPRWEFLAPCKGSNKRGALLLSLQYEPLLGIIEVIIHKAIDLKPMDINGTSDPYVKLWLLYKGKKTDKKKTAVFKNNLNPEFEQKFEFSCPMERLRETQLEISVMDKDLIGRNEVIGKIYLGYKSQSLEKQHWKDMLNNVRSPVKQWHVLKV